MLEFMFFDEGLMQRFIAFARARGIICTSAVDRVAGWVVGLGEEMDDDTLADIEACYDGLMDEQEALAEQQEGWVEKHLAGVQVTLPDGTSRTVRLDAAMARRLLEHFAPREMQALVEAIAHSLAADGDGPICRR